MLNTQQDAEIHKLKQDLTQLAKEKETAEKLHERQSEINTNTR